MALQLTSVKKVASKQSYLIKQLFQLLENYPLSLR